MGEARLPLVVMSSLPTNLSPYIISDYVGNPIEVVDAQMHRITVVGPYETVVLVGTTKTQWGSTALMSTQGAPQGDGTQEGGAAEQQSLGYVIAERSLGGISSIFTDETADTEIVVSDTSFPTSFSSLSCALEGVSCASAAAWCSTCISSNMANLLSTIMNIAGGPVADFNDAASSAMKKMNLYADALADVGLMTSS
jgi:hypothetical protein